MAVETGSGPRESLARAAKTLAAGLGRSDSLELIAAAAREATGAELAAVHVLDPATGGFVVRAAAPADSPLAAEVLGARTSREGLQARIDREETSTVVVPALADDRLAGALEVFRGAGLDQDDRDLAALVAAQLGLVLLQPPGDGSRSRRPDAAAALEHAGEALVAGATLAESAQHAAWLAADAIGAVGASVWRARDERLELVAVHGDAGELEAWRELAGELLAQWRPWSVEERDDGFVVSVQLGQPAFGVLQLLHRDSPSERELGALAAFGVRAAHALRAGERARELELELDRTRALLSVVGEAISRLSLAHTLETALERSAELLAIDRVGIYLRDRGQLLPAAGRGLSAGHEEVAASLFELALGPLRARDTIEVRAAERDRLAAPVRRTLRAAGLDGALGVPLRVRDEAIGLLVAYPGPRRLEESETALLASLAAQLGVAVQNALLHEQTKELGDALSASLASERQAAKRLGALYEISRSFTQSLSLETTLDAVATTVVDVLGVDAAVLRVPGERGDTMVARAVHVADERAADAIRTILEFPQPRNLRLSAPLLLDAPTAARLGGSHALLVPFLERGSTAAVLPIETPSELLALLMIISLDPGKPIGEETLATAATIASQAALAIDNARLYQQQKAFAETIQQALLPRKRPQVPGLEVGAVYESAARVAVGGDVYDFVELPEGRLAVVLGDVTGHGIDATADMAMAKFVFRSLVREHAEPGDFLAHANEVVAGEIETGKFITMTYIAVDGRGALACASAGHPAPRLVMPDGRIEELACGGLALGIDVSQRYDEARTTIARGTAIVLYTDGVIEARAREQLYGVERLDTLLAARSGLSAQAIAEAVLADCRAFAGGELADDCAAVVVKRA